jgi:proteasome accessory factor A
MWLAATGLRFLHAPLAMGFLALVKCVALRPQRKHLSSFLASRCLLDGAGYVDEQSRFWISQRGASINAVIGYGSYGSCRPLFRCDALLRDLIASPFGSMRRYRRLFRRRQRIEIAIGDSGMCQQSQYLRWGTTALVLDMIENDRRCRLPRLRDPIAGIREFSRDWMLVRTLSVGAQREISALELQRSYAKQVHCWLESLVSVNAEAWQIYELWQSTLNQMVVSPKEDPPVPMPLVGRIDWISKLWLLRQMEPNTPWSVRKKIDLRYHELSESGYHRKLDASLKIAPIAREEDIDRARRTPPSDPRPLRRGNLIREFADSEAQLQVDWTSARYSLDGVWYVVTF